jgi:hypothetical protein
VWRDRSLPHAGRRAVQLVVEFSAVRVETTGPLSDAVRKSSSVPALLVSIFTRPIEVPAYRLWVDGRIVPTGRIASFRSNVIDLAANQPRGPIGGSRPSTSRAPSRRASASRVTSG